MLRFAHISLRALLILAYGGIGIGNTLAQTPLTGEINPEALDKLEDAQKAAKENTEKLSKQNRALEKDLKKLQQDLIKTVGETAAHEKQVYKIENELKDIQGTENDIKEALFLDRNALITLLGSLQSIQATPPPQFMGSQTSPLDSVRTHHLMSVISQDLQVKADNLSSQLQDIQTLERRTLKQQKKLASTETALLKKRKQIKSLVQKKSTLKKSISSKTRQEQAKAKQLASEAEDLRELISRFESQAKGVAPRVKPGKTIILKRSPQEVRPRLKPHKNKTASNSRPNKSANSFRSDFAKARGTLRAPVTGKLVKSYGQNHKGLSYRTSARAQVIAPFDGRVEFSGPFKNYENVVILNVGDDYFILLTGLGDIYVDTGDKLKIGEPVGRMPSNLAQKGELYLEFRKNGRPLNPKPWIGTHFAKSQ